MGEIPRPRRRTRGAALIGVLALTAFICNAVPGAQASGLSLEDVLQRVATNSGEAVGFEESRYLGVVTKPLESSGTLRFEPPDRLIKETEKPYRETAIVDGDRLTVLNAAGAETRSISLWASEELRLVFDSLRAVLRGDAKALAALFQVSVSGDEAHWTIELTPQPGGEDGQIERITVQGEAGRIASFEIRESNGDRALIRLTANVHRS